MTPASGSGRGGTPKLLHLSPGPEAVGVRLDAWLAEQLDGQTRSQIQLATKQDQVLVNGEPRPARYRLREGDRITLPLNEPAVEAPLAGEPIPLEIVYEDDAVLVVNKPCGLVVHPAPGHRSATLVNALLAHVGPGLASVGGDDRCGIVHRLDKMTSGLLVVAKHEAAHAALTEALAERRVDRRYLGLALGHFDPPEGVIDRPVGRRRNERKLMGIVDDGREARTSYRVLLQADAVALLLLKLHTGRTHQIRVHLQSIGRPVFADPEYGYTKKHTLSRLNAALRSEIGPLWPDRQMLHAAGLRFRHPVSGEIITGFAPPPADMTALLAAFFPGASLDLGASVFAPFARIDESEAQA
jgi:23S rRNA pseudouridine1911/1915/1917 synthase